MRRDLRCSPKSSIKMFFIAILFVIQSINVMPFMATKKFPSNIIVDHIVANCNDQGEIWQDINFDRSRSNNGNRHVSRITRNKRIVLYADKRNIKKKENDDKKLGGTVATRNLFALTEIFGKITSIFQTPENGLNNGISEVIDSNSGDVAAVENVEVIAEKIRKEYEAIFWAVSEFLFVGICSLKTFLSP